MPGRTLPRAWRALQNHQKMKKAIKLSLLALAAVSLGGAMVSCDDDDVIDNVAETGFSSVPEVTTLPFSYENDSQAINFTAKGNWRIEAEPGVDWVSFSPTAGKRGENTVKVNVARNTGSEARGAIFNLISGEDKVLFTVQQPEFGGTLPQIEKGESTIIDPATIPDYDKFFSNSEHGAGILNTASNFSFARYKSSEHFFVFWGADFGDDPNASVVPAAMRVDIDDLLAKAEQFYNTNVNKLKMATVGEGKSYLDRYKMQIYLLYQDEWLATGSGYDNVIGALWVNPSTCQPVGSTIAHEIGHSFQYQVYCDKVLQGAPDDMRSGFRYGFDADGASGCSYWEQCAQWQAMRDYPQEQFGGHVATWTANCHRIFYHEWMRYASYWLQSDWVTRHGMETYSRIWKESVFPEDPIETYTRLYNSSDMQKTYDELYQYASHMVYYDIDGIREYATNEAKGNYSTQLFRTEGTTYQVGYKSTPGTTGFNVIRLNDAAGKTVKANVKALAPGSALAKKDAGSVVNGDGAVVGATSTYNKQTNTSSNFRCGYVAIVGGKPVYSPMSKGSDAVASYAVPEGATSLYFVIMGSPDSYNRVAWDDNETNDEQWPYTVTFEGTDVYGYTEPSLPEYTKVDDNTLNVSYNLAVNINDEGWVAGSLNLMSRDISDFLGISFAELSSIVNVPHAGTPVAKEEGKIAVFNKDADGKLNNNPTANDGYWLTPDGTVAEYGAASIYYEVSGINLTLGKKGAVGTDGQTLTMRPVYVYTKDGVEKTVNITVNYNFYAPAAQKPRIKYSKMKLF